MDFCPNCGAMILPSSGSLKCSKCSYSENSSEYKIRLLKIKPYSKYITSSDKNLLKYDYNLFMGLIENLNQVDITKEELIENFNKIVEISNNNFIEIEKKTVLKQFRQELNERDSYINDSDKNDFKKRYNKPYCKYYNVLDFDKKIEAVNKLIIKKQKDIYYQQFKEDLNKFSEYISDSDKIKLQENYTVNGFDFYKEFNGSFFIDEYNKKLIEKQKNQYLIEFKDGLTKFVKDSDRIKFKDKYNKDYFNFYDELDFDSIIDEFNESLVEKEKSRILENLKDEYIPYSQKKDIEKDLNLGLDISKIIDEHNDEFIQKQMKIDSEFFDHILGRSLDKNQRIAVLTDEDNTQIVAGAGTGKTLTIQAKVKYLIEKQGVLPEDILCISFSNSARDDLAEKLKKTIGDSPVEVRTFHSLGYSILGRNGRSKEVPEHEISDLIKIYFEELNEENSSLIKDIVEFFCYYYNIIYLNTQNLKFETFKSRLTTLNEYDEVLSEYLQIDNVRKTKEYMLNIPDLVVSNYLFIHNINYEYQNQAVFKAKNYNQYITNYFNYLFADNDEYVPEEVKLDLINELHDNFACKIFDYYPNFFLPDEDIYIDFVPTKSDWRDTLNDKEKEKIIGNLKSRDKINDSFKTKLLTIFDYGEDVDKLLEDIGSQLSDYEINIRDTDYKILFEKLISQEGLPEYRRFIQTVESFINLFKGNAKNIDYDGKDISKKMFKQFLTENHEKYSNSLEKRNNFFLKIIEKIYELYTHYLKENENDYIDFNDMINDAVIELRNGAYIHEYKYVIVDEYQDTSYTRYNLLQEIQNATGAKVVVVGDDWQSIYGFTGCDVNLFSQFDRYFENPKMVKINITRRNSQKLIDIVGEFIQQNENQIPKKLKSDNVTNKLPIKIFEHVSRAEEVLALMNILDSIYEENNNANVLILGRNNYDIYDVVCREIFTTIPFKDFTTITYERKPELNIEFRTVHKSKGLEADYVVVLNLNDQINGFPNKIVDDPVLDFVNNKQNENINYPEERRLFYVALTRTKNNVYLFTKSKKPSQFIEEIRYKKGVEILKYAFSNDEIMFINQLLQKRFEVIDTGITCPKCGSGEVKLIVNNEKGTSYFRCSNFCGWEGAKYHNKDKDDGTRRIAYVKYVEPCPRKDCQGILIVRKNSNDGSLFLGCTSYPNCYRTKSLNLNDEIIDNVMFEIKQSEFNTTRFGVYYLNEYVPEDKRELYDKEQVDYSKRLIGFKKDMDDYSVNLFTQDLIEYISQLSNKKLQNKAKLVLIAVPSSKVDKTKSSIKKSIDIIEETYNSGELKFDYNCDKEIINYKNLLKRVKDVPTAHLGEGRATCEQHVDSIECMENNLSNEDVAYVILDDITTTGNSMMACNELLLKAGVKNENIYNIALGATVRDDDEEI